MTIRKGQTQEFFFLVQDNELAVISTRPYLGEVSRRTGFMRVQGLVLASLRSSKKSEASCSATAARSDDMATDRRVWTATQVAA